MTRQERGWWQPPSSFCSSGSIAGRSSRLGDRRRGKPVRERESLLTAVAHDVPHGIEHATSTGLDSRKLAIWTFIGSECMFFATLISNYLVNKGKSLVGPFPHEAWVSPTGQHFKPILEIPLVTLGTALLLFSSLFVVLALASAQRGNRRGLLVWLRAPLFFGFFFLGLPGLLVWLGATLFCGFFFVGMQVYEFTHFVHKGLTLKTNLFGASFFTLTGFHGTHVTLGVIWLLTLWIEAFRGKVPPAKSLNLEIAALYWHFVDVVWIVIFPVVYLIK